MAGVACYGNRVTPAKGGSSLVLYKKRYSLLRMDQTNVICWVECRLVYNWREKEVEGERERERENDGWIKREKEEVEDLYLSFSKVSSLTRVTTVKSVLTLSIT